MDIRHFVDVLLHSFFGSVLQLLHKSINLKKQPKKSLKWEMLVRVTLLKHNKAEASETPSTKIGQKSEKVGNGSSKHQTTPYIKYPQVWKK